MIQTDHTIHFDRGNRGKRQARAEKKESVGGGQTPRISRLMALAIHLDQLIREGRVTDQAELARLGYVTRARLTQIMNLLHLAPDIQEEILFLPEVLDGHVPVAERDLRPIAATARWEEQRRMWNAMSCG